MRNKTQLGPLLGFEGDDRYSIALLTDKAIKKVTVNVDGKKYQAQKETDTHSGQFWCARFSVKLGEKGRPIPYTLECEGGTMSNERNEKSWQFFVPGEKETPRIAYTSCNGFSSASLMMSTPDPYSLWEEMYKIHESQPFSLMVMGGDQLYADEVWTKVPELAGWAGLKVKEQITKKASAALIAELEMFYEQLYITRFNRIEVARMLASIPTVMIWDDHDIFDGWGSYPDDLQNCPVFKAIYGAASRYFEIFQLRCKATSDRLNTKRKHFAFGLHYRNYSILAMDHRSERTIKRVMSDHQWTEVIQWLDNESIKRNLLVLSGVPVVYRDFAAIETSVDITWWAEEVTDDLKDHWRAKEHQGERMRLIHQLLRNLENRKSHDAKARTVILSGDVHVGCLGVIIDKRKGIQQKIHQIVSSAIVHPAPTGIQWAGILAITNDRNEFLNEDHMIETAILRPIGSDTYIRSRNFVTLHEGTDDKLWINWINESKDEPVYPLE